MIKACFSGHRDIPEEILSKVRKNTSDTIRDLYSRGVKTFKAGGALGFDTLAALAVLDLKKELPDIRLELELIAPTQDSRFSPSEREVFRAVIESADSVNYASDIYTRPAIFSRNRNLVDDSAYCICYLTKTTGGTAYTVNYAAKRGLEIINVAKM